jgi:hypothetical protein
VQRGIEKEDHVKEDHVMTLIGDGSAKWTRRGLVSAFFPGLLALAVIDSGAANAQGGPPPGPPPQFRQIKLTEKQVQGFIAAAPDINRLFQNADPSKPDPKLDAQAAAIAKKAGFASLDEFDDVVGNISVIMGGIDPQTKKFTEPPEQIKADIAALKADKSASDADKKTQLAQMEAALKLAKPIQFKENIALVTKYVDKLAPLMPQPQ